MRLLRNSHTTSFKWLNERLRLKWQKKLLLLYSLVMQLQLQLWRTPSPSAGKVKINTRQIKESYNCKFLIISPPFCWIHFSCCYWLEFLLIHWNVLIWHESHNNTNTLSPYHTFLTSKYCESHDKHIQFSLFSHCTDKMPYLCACRRLFLIVLDSLQFPF